MSSKKELWEALERGSQKAREVAKETGQNPDDMTFSLDGKSVKSIADINAEGVPVPFMCMLADTPALIPNCHKMVCDSCGRAVWMSPATKITFDKIDKKLILCVPCMMTHCAKLKDKEKDDGQPGS